MTSLHFWSICSWLGLRFLCRCLSQYLFLQAKCRIVANSLGQGLLRLSIHHLSCQIPDQILELLNLDVALGLLIFLPLDPSYFQNLLFQLVNERIFSFHVLAVDIKLALSLLMGLLKVSQFLLLLFNPILVNLPLLNSLLKALLDYFELLILVIQVIAHFPGIDLVLSVFSLHLEYCLSPLAELQFELLYLV